MPGFLISVLTCLLLLAGSCSNASSTQSSNTSTSAQTEPWSLELKTFGGFVGVGRGNIAVNSEGKCTYSENNRDQVKSPLTGTLNPRQLQPIKEAVARLDPKGWNKPGLNVSAADAFGYKLEFRTGPDLKQLTPIQWYDNTADQLPEDLKRLSAALEQTMKNRCGGPP